MSDADGQQPLPLTCRRLKGCPNKAGPTRRSLVEHYDDVCWRSRYTRRVPFESTDARRVVIANAIEVLIETNDRLPGTDYRTRAVDPIVNIYGQEHSLAS